MVERLMVIDDSTTIQKVVQIAFAKLDIQVSIASSYIEAMNEIHQHTPNVVIADSSLPGIRGPEDYGNMRRSLAHIPFIILIGSYDGLNEESFRSYGFDHFLRKPFEASDLINCVELAIGHSLQPRRVSEFPNRVAPVDQVSGEPSAGIPTPPPLRGAPLAESDDDDVGADSADDTEHPAPQPFSIVLSELDDDLEDDADEQDFSLPTSAHRQEAQSPVANAPKIGSDDSDPSQAEKARVSFGIGADESVAQDSSSALNREGPGFAVREATETGFEVTREFDNWDDSDGFMPPPPPEEDDELAAEEGGLASSPSPLDQATNWEDDVDDDPQDSNLTSSFAPKVPESKPETSTKKWVETPPEGVSGSYPDENSMSLNREQAHGLIEPFLREELAQIVRASVQDYCERHFARLARDVISEEIQKLLSSKSRLLIDK